jgi:hypothetical protein
MSFESCIKDFDTVYQALSKSIDTEADLVKKTADDIAESNNKFIQAFNDKTISQINAHVSETKKVIADIKNNNLAKKETFLAFIDGLIDKVSKIKQNNISKFDGTEKVLNAISDNVDNILSNSFSGIGLIIDTKKQDKKQETKEEKKEEKKEESIATDYKDVVMKKKSKKKFEVPAKPEPPQEIYSLIGNDTKYSVDVIRVKNYEDVPNTKLYYCENDKCLCFKINGIAIKGNYGDVVPYKSSNDRRLYPCTKNGTCANSKCENFHSIDNEKTYFPYEWGPNVETTGNKGRIDLGCLLFVNKLSLVKEIVAMQSVEQPIRDLRMSISNRKLLQLLVGTICGLNVIKNSVA